MKENKKIAILLIVLLLLVGITTSYVARTYAKYTSEITGKSATAIVAKWNFDVENADVTMDIDFSETYDPETLVANRIAPGTEGSFAFQLTNATTETGVAYTVSFGAATGVPTNLKFYTDDTYSDEFDITAETFTGVLPAKAETGHTIEVYRKWAYETGAVNDGIAEGDGADTTNGKAGGEEGTKLEIPVTITGVQVEPTAVVATP